MVYIRRFDELGMTDIEEVGGKNASIGEMIANLQGAGVRVPSGFATTASAFREFLAQDDLDRRIEERLRTLDVADVVALAEAGRSIREAIEQAPLPAGLERAVREAYAELEREGPVDLSVAVRSSATAEDLPEASFAGQQETILNVRGVENVLASIRSVFASLFTDRAIAYRVHHDFDHAEVALSAGVQRMVRSDLGASGVAFTLDTESGFRDAVFVTAAYGLGELLVQGAVDPDEFYLYKPALRRGDRALLSRRLGNKRQRMIYARDGGGTVETAEVPREQQLLFALTDEELAELGRQALAIEEHYRRPMDIEWAKDGLDGKIYILQARPETVQSREGQVLERFRMLERTPVVARGRAVGSRIATGPARVISDPREMSRVRDGDVLVADMTDPDWEPVMKRAAAIVTNRGGRTCHAAIIAREMGVPAVVGCGDATSRLRDGGDVTVCCAEGDEGLVFAGRPRFERSTVELGRMPELPVDIMMNVATPERAFAFAGLPHRGVGLARIEFVVNNAIGVHPQALLDYPDLPEEVRDEVAQRIAPYGSAREFFVGKLAEGVATIAAAFAPQPVIVRLSDFKSNEYAHLLGGDRYEPTEENPMIGFRGASRYRSAAFAPCFAMECEALRRVRDEMGLTNVKVMVPFVRAVSELDEVLEIMAGHGLQRGVNGLEVIMMCEVPSNAVLADAFLERVDGFSIGSNDLTQLTLAIDRDSGLVADLFDEQDPAVLALLEAAIGACKRAGKYVGICGQGPSDHPEFARWLLERGIDSISLNPDTVLETWLYLAGEGEEQPETTT
ncbi:MAG TPA: phosphoenolpyruvate synthase [Trueperaceae bacterium]